MLFDVYSYGMITPSTLHILSSPFPAAEGYAEIERTIRMTGGEALGSSLVLARLGLAVTLDGNWMSKGIAADATLSIMDDFGIDRSRITLLENYDGIEEIVFAAKDTDRNSVV
jgi:hypothetical protein